MDRARIVYFTHSKTTRLLTPSSNRRPANASSVSLSSTSLQAPLASIDSDIIPVTKKKPDKREAEPCVLSISLRREDRLGERQDSVPASSSNIRQSELTDDSPITPTGEQRPDASRTDSFSYESTNETPTRRNTADMTWLTSRRRLQKGPTVKLPPEYQTRARSQSMSCVTRRSHIEVRHGFPLIQDISSSDSSSLHSEDCSDVRKKQTFLVQPSVMKSPRSEISRAQSFRGQPIPVYPNNTQTAPSQTSHKQSHHIEPRPTRSNTLPTRLPHAKQFPLTSPYDMSPETGPPHVNRRKTSNEFTTSPSNEVSLNPILDFQDQPKTSTKALSTSHDATGVRTSVTSNNRGYTKQTVITNVPPGFELEPFHSSFPISPCSNTWFVDRPSSHNVFEETFSKHSSEVFYHVKDVHDGENSGPDKISTQKRDINRTGGRIPDTITNPSAEDCVLTKTVHWQKGHYTPPSNEVCLSIDRKSSRSRKNSGPMSQPNDTFTEEQSQKEPTVVPFSKAAVNYKPHAQISEGKSHAHATQGKVRCDSATGHTCIKNTDDAKEFVRDRLSCSDNQTVGNKSQTGNAGTDLINDNDNIVNKNENASEFKPSWKRNSMRLATLGYTSMSDLTSSTEALSLGPLVAGCNISQETPSHGNESLVSKKEPHILKDTGFTDRTFSPMPCSEKCRQGASIQESFQSHVKDILGDKERNVAANRSLPPRSESSRTLIKRDSFRQATSSTSDLSCAPDFLVNCSTLGPEESPERGDTSGIPMSREKNTPANNSPGPSWTFNTPRGSKILSARNGPPDAAMRNSELLPPISSVNNSIRDSLSSGQSNKQCLTVSTPVLTSSPVSGRVNTGVRDNEEKKVSRQIKRNSMRLATSSISDLTCIEDDIDFGDGSVPVATNSNTWFSQITDLTPTGQQPPWEMDNTKGMYDSFSNTSASPDFNRSYGRKAGLDHNKQRYSNAKSDMSRAQDEKTAPDAKECSYEPSTLDLNRSHTGSLSSSRMNSSFGSFYSCQSLARGSPLANARRQKQEIISKKTNESVRAERPTFLNLSETLEPSLADSSLVYYSAAETSFAEEGNKTHEQETRELSQHYSQPTASVFYWTRPSPYTRPTPRTLYDSPNHSSKQGEHATRTTHVCRKDHFISNNGTFSDFPSARRPGERYFYNDRRSPTKSVRNLEPRHYSNISEKEQSMNDYNMNSSNLSVDSNKNRAIYNNDMFSEDSLSLFSFSEEDFSSPDNHRSPPSLGRPKRKQYAGFDSQPLPIDSFLSDSSSVYTGGVSCSSRTLSTVGEVINPSDSFLDSGDSVSFGLEDTVAQADTPVCSPALNAEQEEDNADKYRDRVRQLCALTFSSVSKSRDVDGSSNGVRDEVDTPRESRRNLIPSSDFNSRAAEDEDKERGVKATDSPLQDGSLGESGRTDGYKARAMKGASSAVVPRAKFSPRRKYFSSKDIMDLIRTSEKASEGVATSLTSLERHANKVCRAILCCSSDLRAKGYTF